MTLSRIGMMTPNIGGIDILLDAIAAVIIGGTSLTGGRGTIKGTFIGVIFIGLVINGLNILNVAPVWHRAVKGLIIILALLVNYYVEKERW